MEKQSKAIIILYQGDDLGQEQAAELAKVISNLVNQDSKTKIDIVSLNAQDIAGAIINKTIEKPKQKDLIAELIEYLKQKIGYSQFIPTIQIVINLYEVLKDGNIEFVKKFKEVYFALKYSGEKEFNKLALKYHTKKELFEVFYFVGQSYFENVQ